jgi:hypothetical protein
LWKEEAAEPNPRKAATLVRERGKDSTSPKGNRFAGLWPIWALASSHAERDYHEDDEKIGHSGRIGNMFLLFINTSTNARALLRVSNFIS